MKADPRGVVAALRRSTVERNWGMVDFLADEIVTALERRDQMDEYKAQRDGAVEALKAISSLLHRGLHNPMPDAPTVEAAALEARDIARATIQSIEGEKS